MLSFAPKESPDVLRRLRSAAQRVLADEHGLGDAVATVASIPCREPGCPPFETFVQILSDVLPVAFRLNKRPADVSDAELASALRFAVAGARLAPASADAPPPPPLPPAPHAFKRTPDATIGIAALRGVVREVVDATDTIDVHTHLFPPSHGDLCAYGIDALLTYHYLVSEFFMVAPMDLTHALFFAKSKRAQADLVWDGLFVRRTPLSEACVGVLTTLAAFSELRPALDPPLTAASLVPIRAFFDAADPAEHAARVLAMAGVRYVVCTNVPFDAREASEFVDETCCVDVDAETFASVETRPRDAAENFQFRTALRVDALLKGDWATIAASLAQRGLPETLAGARTFLKAWAKRYGAVYLMASSPADFAYAHVRRVGLDPPELSGLRARAEGRVGVERLRLRGRGEAQGRERGDGTHEGEDVDVPPIPSLRCCYGVAQGLLGDASFRHLAVGAYRLLVVCASHSRRKPRRPEITAMAMPQNCQNHRGHQF